MVDGVTDQAASLLNKLLAHGFFDCVISSVYQNSPGSNRIRFSGWDKLLTAEEQKVAEIVSAHTHHYAYTSTYSAYSGELEMLLKKENGGKLPECVFVTGFDLECGVLMTAADLLAHGIRPMVLTTYCGSCGGDEAIFAGTRTLESLIGKNNIYHEPVTDAQDLERILAQAQSSVHTSHVPSEKKAQTLVDMLYQKGWRIAFAESCTGGRAAAGIVDIASASTVFDASFVTYANQAKIQFLGVPPETIDKHGVVSEPVAGEMAIGAAREAGAQVGVGISGIAGPGGATANKPVGMVCFGFYIGGKTCTKTVQFGAIGRNAVRQASVDFVYSTLIKLLSEEHAE